MEEKPPVKQIHVDPEKNVSRLLDDFKQTGFNARRLGLACEIYEKMLGDEKCVKIMTLAGAMVPAGMQRVISDYIREGFVDILVTTGANLTHDIIEGLGCHHYQGTEAVSDEKLLENKTNRIYDVFMPDESYEHLEEFVKTLEFDLQMPLAEFLDYLGKEMGRLKEKDVENSIIRNCHLKNVPIFCPAFTDCGLGIQLLLNHRGLQLDMFADLDRLINMAWDFESAGVFIIGGGVPKNFIFQSLQFSPNSATYAIQLTTDRPEPGGLSGATLNEAISWGKVNPEASRVTVICDATIALPLILAYLRDNAGK